MFNNWNMGKHYRKTFAKFTNTLRWLMDSYSSVCGFGSARMKFSIKRNIVRSCSPENSPPLITDKQGLLLYTNDLCIRIYQEKKQNWPDWWAAIWNRVQNNFIVLRWYLNFFFLQVNQLMHGKYLSEKHLRPQNWRHINHRIKLGQHIKIPPDCLRHNSFVSTWLTYPE